MNAVRNKARLTNTVFGGVCCKPIAERSRDKTTIILVKLVSIIRMLGARLNIVTRAMIWIRFELHVQKLVQKELIKLIAPKTSCKIFSRDFLNGKL